MKIFFTKHNILFCLFIIAFSIQTNAVVDYKPDAKKKTTIVNKQKKAKKKGLFKRWKEKWILKKLKKQQKKLKEKNTFTQKADLGLTFGVGSVLFWLVAILSLFIYVGDFFLLAFLILALISSFLGIIYSSIVLKKTKDSKEEYRKERRKVKWGLFFSIIALLPLIVVLPWLILWIS